MNSAAPYFLGRVEVNPLEHTLVRDERTISLQPKFIELLCYLAEQQPELLTRQQIIDHVWDGNNYVGEKALTNAIWHLRKALKELDSEQEFIETVRKSGYRLLVAPVFAEQQDTVFLQISSRNIKQLGLFIGFVLSIVFAWLLWPEPQQKVYQQPELITQYPGRELFPSVSNDGRYLVYSWRQMDRKIDLYRKDLQQPDLKHTKITHTPGSESRSVWAHDDSKLYYYRRLSSRCEVLSVNMSDFAIEKMKQLYHPFCMSRERFIAMDVRSAEMTKYAANTMLATKISFMNEIANICERVGADANQVRIGIGSDKRIGYDFIYPGIGYGGTCFPKDISALINLGKKNGYIPKIISAVEEVNQHQK